MVLYEWDCEEVLNDEDETVVDHNHGTTLAEVQEFKRDLDDHNATGVIALVRDDDDGRTWAYLRADGTLPVYFEDAFHRPCARVPQRFHKETKRPETRRIHV